jgi:Ca-activated chloride channel homolog
MLRGVELRDPWLAVLVLAIPAMFLIREHLRRRGLRDAAIRFSDLRPFKGLPPTARLRYRHLVPALRVLALGLIVAALLRPQRGTELAPETAQGISILMVCDRSGSMKTPDFEIDGKAASRIEAVKKVFRDFVAGGDGLPGRLNDAVGIVTFSGYAVPVAPLTLDHGAVLQFLDGIRLYEPRLDSRGRPLDDQATLQEETMTAMGDGLALAAGRMKDVASKSKVIILLSDGVSNFGQLDPLEAAELAQSFGIRIYSIGIGKAGIVMQEIDDPFFGRRRVPVRSELDEATLKAVAEKTGGKYFNADSTDALRQVYAEIDAMEKTKIDSSRFYRYEELFLPLALAALAALVLEVLLSQTVFRRIP